MDVPPYLPRPPAERANEAPNKAGPAIALVGGALVAIGSLMPWATITHVFGTVNLNGTEGDGKITLVVGLVLVFLAVLELTGTGNIRAIILIVAVVAAGLGVYEIVNLNDRLVDVNTEFARASVGVGLNAVVGGGVLAVLGSLLSR